MADMLVEYRTSANMPLHAEHRRRLSVRRKYATFGMQSVVRYQAKYLIISVIISLPSPHSDTWHGHSRVPAIQRTCACSVSPEVAWPSATAAADSDVAMLTNLINLTSYQPMAQPEFHIKGSQVLRLSLFRSFFHPPLFPFLPFSCHL